MRQHNMASIVKVTVTMDDGSTTDFLSINDVIVAHGTPVGESTIPGVPVVDIAPPVADPEPAVEVPGTEEPAPVVEALVDPVV